MKKIDYKPNQVRLFLGILFLIVLFLMFKGGTPVFAVAVAALVLGLFMIFPKFFFPLFRLIMVASAFVGELLFSLVIAVIFFFVLTPLSLLMRTMGTRFLKGTHELGDGRSCYVDGDPRETDMSKQF